jgi:hypothetical protein
MISPRLARIGRVDRSASVVFVQPTGVRTTGAGAQGSTRSPYCVLKRWRQAFIVAARAKILAELDIPHSQVQELTRYAGVPSGMASRLSFSFYPPVSIELGGAGEIRYVTSLREAAEVLMSANWPGSGPRCEKAADALLGAMQGHVKPDVARQAFVEAAMEAHLLADADHRLQSLALSLPMLERPLNPLERGRPRSSRRS